MDLKILITGANGLTGTKLVRKIHELGWDYLATSAGACRLDVGFPVSYAELDITDEVAVFKLGMEYRPTHIINAAAMTLVDECEDHQVRCDRINVDGVRNGLRLAEEIDAHYIQISTDFIFSGEDGPYTEASTPDAKGYYALSKWKAEQLCHKASCKTSICRTAIVYGHEKHLSRGNVVRWLTDELRAGKAVNMVEDQFRNPTWAEDLATLLTLVVEFRADGIFNATGGEFMSMLELARRIARFAGADEGLISPIATATLGRKAPRPPSTQMIIEKARKELGYRPHTLEEALTIMDRQIAGNWS